MARSRSGIKTKRIAIAIEIDQPYPHHLGCYEGILRYAATKPDWHIVVDPFVIGATNRSGVKEYDGIVGRINSKIAKEAKAAGIPVVNHWMNSPARNLPSVLPDCRQGGRMVAEHLLARGFRRFGYAGAMIDRTRIHYLAGFEPPIRERGLSVEKFNASLRSEANARVFGQFYNNLKNWMAKLTLPIALVVPLEVTALYIAQVCRELNLSIPHDVGIVACRENPTICLQTTPTLSCIEDDNERIGYCAAELLDKLMRGKSDAPADPIWIEPKAMHVRGSTDAFVSEDPIISHAMRFIADHCCRTITTEDVAAAIHTSPRTLQLRFAQHLERSVYSEITRLRIETVKRILIDTDAPLEFVASDHGFTDVSHLIKNFRRLTGMTPGEFRKKQR